MERSGGGLLIMACVTLAVKAEINTEGEAVRCTSALNAIISSRKANKPCGKKIGANFGVFLAANGCQGVLNAEAAMKKYLSARDAEL
jgi:hypothetical protein